MNSNPSGLKIDFFIFTPRQDAAEIWISEDTGRYGRRECLYSWWWPLWLVRNLNTNL